MPNRIKILTLFTVLTIGCLAAAGVAAYLYMNKGSVAGATTGGGSQDAMMKRLGSFMELPQEKPTIILVADRDKLQDQEFFQKAKNGDMIVLYEGIRKIILYRPSTGKVIDIAPLVYNTPTAAATSEPTRTAKPDPRLKRPIVATDSAASPSAAIDQKREEMLLPIGP